ncbi:MAG: hypothetical protein EAZ91_06925 [Cytophagales bacterium]|nr:MAG: hypothetical protein EAZ91_06925 [Cytophagales bacterium]
MRSPLYYCVRKLGLTLFLPLLFSPLRTHGQLNFPDADRQQTHLNVRVGGYLLIGGGYGLSSSVGFWTVYRHLQPSFNLSLNFVGGPRNIGNRFRYRTQSQFNLIMTPALTYGGGRYGLPQEINSFYFGNLSSVYSNYRRSITVGTNFIVMPRGLGRNVGTYRNRTQQTMYIGLRAGGSDWDINLNVYDDFLFTDTGATQGFADNFDRFYTGGGNLQIRTRFWSIKQYADIYTGNFSRDLFDSPDLYSPYDSLASTKPDKFRGGPKRRRHPRYVAQDPGQKLFNSGRNFSVFEFTPGLFNHSYQKSTNPSFQAFFGWQGGPSQMKAQDWIHASSLSTIDKIGPRFRPDSLHSSGNRKAKERLHYFSPAYSEGHIIWGVGANLNTLFGPKL